MRLFVSTAMMLLASVAAQAVTIETVPGICNPWLAGVPDGTDAGSGDVAPANSPFLVSGLDLRAGIGLQFSHMTGLVNVWGPETSGPDGCFAIMLRGGPQFSKSDILALFNSLLGVFLDDGVPSGAAPTALYFLSDADRDYVALSPALKQVFFIRDGLTSGGVQQTIVVPDGATRVFLGTMDSYQENDNRGAFRADVAVVPVPEPATLALLGIGAIELMACGWRRQPRAA